MYPTRMLRMQPTRAFRFPTPKEPQSAHTISQRLRQLKRVPPELLPIGFVLAVAIGAAVYSCSKKLMTDKTLRLYRNSPESREH
ncbi:NADH-ubiquinone reductase complex 1 MLRQ subunit [Penicillium paradoxum]|uniref:NADH-ubiquinone reductase complex 1 MLRQ subunit n=1 Tax=Penicillium paradoxum TaxID=176176 RepID=UPI0025499B0D|nr:NADH-ubiquinone reductase complex 1 MLRQ subunit [Penicillium paradoxum]KAJ5773021.1 NADH-ubiquinone reductase complex 1 MLRQ subunit [Penicillium paradoxum]